MQQTMNKDMEDKLGGWGGIYAVFILSKSQFPQHGVHYIHILHKYRPNICFLKPPKYFSYLNVAYCWAPCNRSKVDKTDEVELIKVLHEKLDKPQ